MLEYAREAMGLARGKTESNLRDDRLLQLALTRLLEVLGEAAWRVSTTWREAHPEVPWGAIIGMRNRLIHAYDNVDLALVWSTVQDDVPRLVQALERIVR